MSVQVRVNFETLTLQNPDSNGDCKTEYVQVCTKYKQTTGNHIKGNMINLGLGCSCLTNDDDDYDDIAR